MTRRAGFCLGLALLLVPAVALAETIHLHPGGSFEQAAEELGPGDTLIVHAGSYIDSSKITLSTQASAGSPIVIQAADGEDRPLISRAAGSSVQNTINIEGASYLTIRGLEITGNGGDAINMRDGPSYITLEDLEIHDIEVGVNFRSDMHHITVRNNHIYDTGSTGNTGEGMYVGCNEAACVVRDSLIENNWIHDTMDARQGDGIEIKRGSHSNVIRDNVIYNTRYPCILVYGTEGQGRNIVEGNVLWNCGDSGIQAAADATIRNNIILSSPSRAFNSQDHQSVNPANLSFVHNTIVDADECVQLSDWNNSEGLVFANNAIYCDGDYDIGGLDGVVVSGNVLSPGTSELPGSGFSVGRSKALDLLGAASRNVYPTSDSALIDAGNPDHGVPLDFNGTPRNGAPDAGAYTWTTAQNPGWAIAPGFKNVESQPEPEDPPPPPTNLTVN